jgi:hypothetical protein
MTMTVNREETCSPLQIDPILPVLHSHSAFKCQAMANIAPDLFAPRLLDLLRSPDQQTATARHGETLRNLVAGVAGPCRALGTAADHPYLSFQQVVYFTFHASSTNPIVRLCTGQQPTRAMYPEHVVPLAPTRLTMDLCALAGYSTYLWCTVVRLCLPLVKSSFRRVSWLPKQEPLRDGTSSGSLGLGEPGSPMAMVFSLSHPCVDSRAHPMGSRFKSMDEWYVLPHQPSPESKAAL